MTDNRRTYDRIRAALLEHPWAMLPEAFDILLEIVERRVEGREPSAEEKAAAIEAARRPVAIASAPGSIGILPIYGVLHHRAHEVAAVSEPQGTSAEALQQQLQAMVVDPNVSAILLDVNSPGGSVYGIQELADAIDRARAAKPVTAVANALAASAAYWLASQADELVVTPSGQVGSVGVFAAHTDQTRAAEMQGVKVTFVAAGRYKTEGNPFEPLGDAARAQMQTVVNGYYDSFVRAVARGRRSSLANVRENYGEGRLVPAADAVARGMADRVATMKETLDRMQQKVAKASPRAAIEPTQIAAEAPAANAIAAARARLELARAMGGSS